MNNSYKIKIFGVNIHFQKLKGIAENAIMFIVLFFITLLFFFLARKGLYYLLGVSSA